MKRAIIIGAGPAGLTAAYEFVTRTDIKPIILEKSNEIGGLSRTVNYKGNKIDIGGHRFFSKSDLVMQWWLNILPLEQKENENNFNNKKFVYNKLTKNNNPFENGPNPELTDKVMLLKNRLSRIFFIRKFFNYPLIINLETISSLGLFRIVKILWSYLLIRLSPIKNEISLEDFFINRFGKELYKTFFKDYTEKVWGVPCSEISAQWGAQRIKKLSIFRTFLHAINNIFRKKNNSIEQKNIDTSLIEQFMYPKFGPGQMWETVLEIIQSKGGEIIFNADVNHLLFNKNLIIGIKYSSNASKTNNILKADYFFSTMPIIDLIKSFGKKVPKNVADVSNGLKYRDFITVGLLLEKLKINKNKKVLDNWIYIQENDVKVGRIQIFNNWSKYLVADPNKIWIGLEYFCDEGDDLWSMKDKEFINFAIDELHFIDIIDREDVLDSTIIKVPKTYPAYFGTYKDFDIIKKFTNQFDNLFLVGRNGMHKYNNQDHSMLTAITAVNNIIEGKKDKENIWSINIEMEYHEEK